MSATGPLASDGRDPSRGTRLLTIPNQLTIARLLLAIVFFVVLAIDGYDVFESHTLALDIATGLFILAVTTDFLDGYLARRWNLVSTFGRIADPFADKIIVCGAFIMLVEVSDLIQAWYAVVILFREFLVSGLRSFLESRNIPFGAMVSGKLKMIFQSITVPSVLLWEAHFSAAAPPELRDIGWLRDGMYWLTIGLLALTLATTILSCIGYLNRAILALRGPIRDAD